MHSSLNATACWIVEPGRAELRSETLPPSRPDDVLVRALHNAISRGTEALVFRGEVPPSEYERMRAPFQVGDFPGPVKYGYSSVGRVEAGPAEWQGRNVFCLYPHQDLYRVPLSALHALPADLPPQRAVLAANMESALNAVWDAAPQPGDRVAVVGAGVVGLLAARLIGRIPGCEVEVIDTQPARSVIAKALGAGFSLPDTARPDADLVIHASGAGEGLATALSLAGFEATVIEVSWYGERAVSLPLGKAFHARRLRLVSSQVGHVATAQRARWSRQRRMALALELLRDPVLDLLITDSAPFSDLPEVLARLSTGPSATLCQRIDHACIQSTSATTS
jgi:NADPH:quinone reductase-like Zn-dependent oxidoreductase